MALPSAFVAMPFGSLFSGLFFIVLAVAALTSAISILEVPVAFAMKKWSWTRKQAVWWVGLMCFILGVPSALAVGGPLSGLIGDKSFFDWMDFIASNILMPIGGMIVTLFTGYAWKRAGEAAGLTGPIYWVWMFLLRYIAPFLILAIFLYSTGLLDPLLVWLFGW
jgi:NSS family neurotransmitter:Na+ symporter